MLNEQQFVLYTNRILECEIASARCKGQCEVMKDSLSFKLRRISFLGVEFNQAECYEKIANRRESKSPNNSK